MIIFLITIIFLVVVVVCLIVRLTYIERTRISPRECSRQRGDFAVKPFYRGTILQNCGTSRNLPCSFSGVNSVKAAIDRCNAEECVSFSYTADSEVLTLLNPNFPIVTGGSGDVYIRQTGII